MQTKNSIRDQLIDFDKINNEQEDDDENANLTGTDQSTIFIYKMFLAKEKALYQNLNTMKRQNQTFIGFFWAPVEQEAYIMSKIENEDNGT